VAAQVTRSVRSPGALRLREWLIEARRTQGVTQTQLAAMLGRPQSFISKYENGERRLDFVEVLEIAAALRADARDLVGELQRLVP
jgi:transcriptional regulator with XRE-family HTH domain